MNNEIMNNEQNSPRFPPTTSQPPNHLTLRHPLAALILLAFIVLAVIYSLITPPFEAGDESRHYAVVKYMADTGRLIDQNDPNTAPLQHHWSHEGSQPPLYYALAAALTFWIDTGDWNDIFWYNPHTSIGNPLRPDNKNITLHRPDEAWPWRKYILAVHLIRFMSIAMATVTVITAYAIALRLFKGNRWLAAGAMAITAFNPMFIFISASVNNDNAVIMWVTLALGAMVTSVTSQREVSHYQVAGSKYQVFRGIFGLSSGKFFQAGYGLAALLGLLIGLGALSKLYALGLLPLTALLFTWLAYKKCQALRVTSHVPKGGFALSRITYHVSRIALTWTLVTCAVVMLVAGWFYARNALLYQGDFFALQVMRDTAGTRDQAPTLATLRAEFEGFRIAYWALFGGVNILADSWIYTVLDITSLAAAGGVIGFIVLQISYFVFRIPYSVSIMTHHVSRITYHASRITQYAIRNIQYASLPAFTLLLSWCLIMLTGFIAWNLTQPAGQGRLLYPAISAISALGLLGLTWWLPPRGQKIVTALGSLGLFAFASLSPFFYIVPVYAKQPRLTQADLPADLQPVNFTYNGQMRLIGYKLDTAAVRPAQTLPLTLYWELLQPADRDYSIFVHLLGRQRRVVGQIDTYPGGGAWPTTLLKPGDILADHYAIPITPTAELTDAPTRLLIAAGIYDFHELGRPGKSAVNANGQPVEPIIASVKLVPWQWPAPALSKIEGQPINFFDKTTLLNSQIAANQQVITLTWQVNQTFDADYTVFIQAWRQFPLAPGERGLGGEGQYAAGFDGPPVQGDYPTSLWSPGEIVVDAHPLDLSALPPGPYTLLVGLYHPVTGERLPAFGPTGPLPDYAVNAGIIEVGQQE